MDNQKVRTKFDSMSDAELIAWIAYFYAGANDLGREKIQEALSPKNFQLITSDKVQVVARKAFND